MAEYLTLSLFADILITILLIATIAYAVRLSGYLKKFKESRADLENIIKDLSTHITKAEKAVSGLNETVEMSGNDLQKRMDKANAMFDELDMVVQTGDRLANRLEELAIRNRRIIDGGDGDVDDLKRAASYDDRVKKVVETIEREDEYAHGSVFSIRDREAEEGGQADGFTLDDNEVLSEAERDLYNAMQAKQKKGKG